MSAEVGDDPYVEADLFLLHYQSALSRLYKPQR